MSHLAPAVAAWLGGLWVALIVATPYLGDDIINAHIRRNAQLQGLGLGGMISFYTRQWMSEQGRFFPGSLAWTFSLHWFAGSRVVYKLVLGALVVAAIAVMALVVKVLTHSWHAAAVFVVLSFACMQLRFGYDGLTSFSGLLPLTVLLVGASVLVLTSRSGVGWYAFAAVLYGVASVTYETVVVFLPALLAVVFWSRRRWAPCAALAAPAVVELAIVAILRARLSHPPSAAYSINLDAAAVGRTFVAQASAAIPGSQWGFGTAPAPGWTRFLLGAVLVGLPVAAVAGWATKRRMAMEERGLRRGTPSVLVGLGLWMWFSSALLVAVTKRWQDELPTGGAYLPAVFGFFGFAVVAIGGWLALSDRAGRGSGRLSAAWPVVCGLLVGILASMTFAQNVAIVTVMS